MTDTQEIIEKAPWTGGAPSDKPVLRYWPVLNDAVRVAISGFVPIAIGAGGLAFLYQYFVSFPLLATGDLTVAAPPENTLLNGATDIWVNFLLIGLFIHYGIGLYFRDGRRFLNTLRPLGRALPLLLPMSVLYTVSVGLGMVFLVIPGLFLFLMWFLVTPALVYEKCGVESLTRSAELTRSYRWKIFLLNLSVTIASLVIGFALGMVFAFTSPEIAEAMFTPLLGQRLAYSATLAAVTAIATPFYVGLAAAVYGHLTHIKEGGSAGDLLQVFE